MPDKSYFSILVIEDNPGDFELIEEFLREQMEAPIVAHAQNYKEAKAILSGKKITFNVVYYRTFRCQIG